MIFASQIVVERALNSLPEGLLVAFLAWLLLRVLGRQSSGTRFAVWMIALLAIVGLSFAGAFRPGAEHALLGRHLGPQIVVPEHWAVALFGIWAAAVALGFARVVTGLVQVLAIRRSCMEVDPSSLDPAMAETLRRDAGARVVRLALSDRVRVPAAIGFWRPLIVLPSWTLNELSPSDLQPILVHELTHLKRHDDWTNLLQKLVRAVFFFHPAVWWIDARLSIEREMACDDAALESCSNPQAYAVSLVDLLEKSCQRRGWTMAQAAVHRARALSLRLAQILDPKRRASTTVWKPAMGLAAAVSLACFAVAASMPQLIAFGPQAPNAAAQAENLRMVLPAKAADGPEAQGRVVPASYRIPSPVPQHANVAPGKSNPRRVSRTQKKITPMHLPHDARPAVVMTGAVIADHADRRIRATQIVLIYETATTWNDTQAGYREMPDLNAQFWNLIIFTTSNDGVRQRVI